jgi:hypothetical protein
VRVRVLLVFALAGCELVFPLGSDEDGDGELDDEDGCPHIADQSDTDTDGDGVPDECDLSIVRSDESHVFYSFFPDTTPPATSGSSKLAGGTLELGDAAADELSFVDLNVVALEARVEIGFTVLEVRDPVEQFSELGVHSMAADVNDRKLRGYMCFFGRDVDTSYVAAQKTDEDATGVARFDGDLVGFSGTLKHTRVDDTTECRFTRDNGERHESAFDDGGNRIADAGTIAITTNRIHVRLDYIWAVYSTTPP